MSKNNKHQPSHRATPSAIDLLSLVGVWTTVVGLTFINSSDICHAQTPSIATEVTTPSLQKRNLKTTQAELIEQEKAILAQAEQAAKEAEREAALNTRKKKSKGIEVHPTITNQPQVTTTSKKQSPLEKASSSAVPTVTPVANTATPVPTKTKCPVCPTVAPTPTPLPFTEQEFIEQKEALQKIREENNKLREDLAFKDNFIEKLSALLAKRSPRTTPNPKNSHSGMIDSSAAALLEQSLGSKSGSLSGGTDPRTQIQPYANQNLSIGTVTSESAQLYTSPDISAPQLAPLPKGSRVAIETKRGEWIQIIAPTGERAWTKSSGVQIGSQPRANTPRPAEEGKSSVTSFFSDPSEESSGKKESSDTVDSGALSAEEESAFNALITQTGRSK